MPSLDQLPPEQRAIIELVVGRGQTYDDLAETLGMPAGRVRDLAREALMELAPATARRVEPEWRGQLADYLLGQQAGPESTATRAHLKRSEPARAWSLSLLDSLDGLYEDGDRPVIPEADEGSARRRRRDGPATLAPPRRRAAGPGGAPARRRPRPPVRDEEDAPRDGWQRTVTLSPAAEAVVRRRRLIAAAAAAVAVLLAVLVWPIGVLTNDDEESREAGRRPAQARLIGQVLLQPVRGGRGTGLAVLAQQRGRRQLQVVARGLRPNATQSARGPGDAYEVWLYNNRRDARSIGAQVTDRQGNLQGAGPLPANYRDYRYIDVSREPLNGGTEHSGRTVLRGDLRAQQRQPGVGGGGGQPGTGGAPSP